jgi:hypothetical protein
MAGALVEIKTILNNVWDTTRIYPIILQDSKVISRYTTPPHFIHPNLRVIREYAAGPITIISAPGAVGKTTFAKFMSYNKKAYYWDLSKIKLGDNTFLGTIAETFGPANLSAILGYIAAGDITFVFDAFDEAQIISGWEGVDKFVTEIYKYFSSSARPTVMFFSRSETAELLQLRLEELGGSTSFAMFEIDYFNHDEAIHFIQQYLDMHGDNSYSIHKQPFAEAVENIFAAIGHGMNGEENKNIWDNDEIRSFIGYSPVLQTIGSYLYKGKNFEEISHQFEQKKSSSGGIQVIADFIQDLLVREQAKVVDPLKSLVKNIPKEFCWDEIYSPDEQIKYILSYLSNDKKIDPNMFDGIPGWLRKEYITAVNSFLTQHPFYRSGEYSSPAFRDYSLGKLINMPKYETVCMQYMRSGKFIITPLFSAFYQKFCTGKSKGPHIGCIYDSAASKLGYDGSIISTFIKPSSAGTYTVEILNTQYKSNNLELDCIIDESNPLVFERKLQHATIHIKNEIIIGKAEGSIEISDVEIIAGKITIKAKECYLNCLNEENITMKANEYSQPDYSLTVKHIGDGKAEINWPGGELFPWSDYYSDSLPGATPDIEEEYYAMKQILIPFRRHGREDFAKLGAYIDRLIVQANPVRVKMLAYLMKIGILSKTPADHQYHLHETTLNQAGINWSDLKSFTPNSNLIAFLNTFKSSVKM